MAEDVETLQTKLRTEIQAASAADLLPHHRRDALFIVRDDVDFLDAAMAIGADEADRVAKWLTDGGLYRPSLAQLSDWCVEVELRFQFVILQPYVLAQPIATPKEQGN